MSVLIGTAGWSLPRAEQECFLSTGSHLERYASRFPVVEINSSFHRSHRVATWMKWRDSVPDDFRFSVKLPKTITHLSQLKAVDDLLHIFRDEVSPLKEKLSCLLVQLPPKLSFDATVAHQFFAKLRSLFPVFIACEPRHESWFQQCADALLNKHRIARVAADPARVPAAAAPGGWPRLKYYRLHGSPRIYYSAYTSEFLQALAAEVERRRSADHAIYVIFDNTTLGAATRNALDLTERLTPSS